MKDEKIRGWGPQKHQAAVTLSFDNLGEAADLEAGRWPQNQALGDHPSITRVLPKLLKLLEELGLKATFFVEAINTEMYPAALETIAAAGHEIGFHGWRHEKWVNLSRDQESQIFERGLEALEKMGIYPKGFRPPGGQITPATIELLQKFGFSYCSPAGYYPSIEGQLVILPFEWKLIDAYFYHWPFKVLREVKGDQPEPFSPPELHKALQAALANIVEKGAFTSLLFHPGMEDDQERFAVMREILFNLKGLGDSGQVWGVPCCQLAEWMLAYPAPFKTALVLDTTSF